MTNKLKCQMCGHEQGVNESRNNEIFDTCVACGARILRDPKDTRLARAERAEKELAMYKELKW